VNKDGRYKWTAHRFFEFFRRHENDFWQWGSPMGWIADGLMDAYRPADAKRPGAPRGA